MARKSEKAYQRLRTLKPAKLAAIVDGEARPLALRNGRGKWDGCLNAAHAMGAEAIECQDDDDAILEIIVLNAKKHGAGVAIEELDQETTEKVGEVRALVELCLNAADRSVGRQESHVGQVLDAAVQVMKAAADRAERGERAMDKLLRAHAKLLMRETGDEDDGMGGISDGLAMMSAMLHGNPDALRQMAPGAAGAGGGNGFSKRPGEQMVSVPKSLVDKAVAAMQRQAEEDAAAAATVVDVEPDPEGDSE